MKHEINNLLLKLIEVFQTYEIVQFQRLFFHFFFSHFLARFIKMLPLMNTRTQNNIDEINLSKAVKKPTQL